MKISIELDGSGLKVLLALGCLFCASLGGDPGALAGLLAALLDT